MKRQTALIAALLCALAAAAAIAWAPRTPADAELDRALQGAWCNSDDGGKTCWGYDVFDNGQSRFCGRIPENGQVQAGASAYTVNGRRVCHMVTSVRGDGEPSLRVGQRLCFQVLSIDARLQSFRDEAAGQENRIYRIPIEDVRCPDSNGQDTLTTLLPASRPSRGAAPSLRPGPG